MSEFNATLGMAGAEPRERVGLLFMSIYALAYFGLWMALLTPVIVSMALRVTEIDPANKEANLSLILGLGAIVALIANPVAGYFSDRTTSRFGMRRPWMLGGVLLGTLGLYLIATGGFNAILFGWLLTQLGLNATLAAIVAVLPDQVPVEQRGTVSGVLAEQLTTDTVGQFSLWVKVRSQINRPATREILFSCSNLGNQVTAFYGPT